MQVMQKFNSMNKVPSKALLYARTHYDIETVKMLLDKGANIDAKNASGKTPLHYAIDFMKLDVIELLLKHKADVNAGDSYGRTPLHVAAKLGYIDIVEALLQRHDVNINATDRNGRTALHYTSERYPAGYDMYYHTHFKGEIAKLLLSKGANVDALTKDGETALHYAVENGKDTKVLEALLEYNANVNVKQKKDGTTALHIAAKFGCEVVVKLLIEHGGADINSTDNCGQTALHIASQKGNKDDVLALLEYGADINVTSSDNQTPLDLAIHAMARIGQYRPSKRRYGPDIEKTAEALIRHIVKMHTTNLYVSEKNLLSMESSKLSDFKDKCEKEIASMKREKINNFNTSFYDILAKGTSSLAINMRNENIVQVLKSDDYKMKFPIYASMIESNFRKGMERKELLEPSYKIYHFLFRNFPELPYNCTEKIFSYLSNEDLRILMDAAHLLSRFYLAKLRAEQ